ncbi:MAG: peptide deformylase [Candidatus Auribacterota bacterium]|jgi:peptide deformylase|nr:peptide deformylase [Candidatus Auribacterota bacterium]
MEIAIYGNPVLRKKAKKIPLDKLHEYRSIADQMFEVMREDQGIGLAAQQVGLTDKIMVIDTQDSPDSKMVVINPEITSYSKQTDTMEEGCLSFPGIRANIVRAQTIEVTFYDLEGKFYRITCSDLIARVFQHEIDHLNGVLFIDRMTPAQKLMLKRKLKKLRESQETQSE